MILANTKATGYSLGQALYWPDNPGQLSTGLIQGISISLLMDVDASIPELEVTKFAVVGNHVSLAIAGADIFCSMDGYLSDTYTVYPLESTSPAFVNGWVGLYPSSTERILNLVGAKINPLYIHIGIRPIVSTYKFCLYDGTQPVTSTSLIGLKVSSTSDIAVTSSIVSGGVVYSASVNDTTAPAEVVDSSSIYYINGSAVSGGNFKIDLPEGWTVMGNALCARIANTSTEPSCTAHDYITELLSPINFVGDRNPLSTAFPDGSSLDMEAVSNTRFNGEYEISHISGGAGLLWNEFSVQHDGSHANAD